MLRIRRRPRIHAPRGQRLGKLRPVVERSGAKVGYSNSRTCEIGLSARSGVPYVSIVYLVDACTTPKENPGA